MSAQREAAPTSLRRPRDPVLQGGRLATVLDEPCGEDRRLPVWGRISTVLPLMGPAFVAAIAYVDPGNFAANVQAGGHFGYLLLWVVLAANVMAMVIQYLSAKVGIATGSNLAELCRDLLPRPVTWGLWIQVEIIAMATDVAELVGAAIALNILFGFSLFAGGLLAGAAAFALVALQPRGQRRFEVAIGTLLAVVLIGFLYDTVGANPNVGGVARGLVPSFAGRDSAVLATAILGATVMPHVVYLHSALTQTKAAATAHQTSRRILRFQRIDVGAAMAVAGLVNLAMLAVFAALFHHAGQDTVNTIQGAYGGIKAEVGSGAALAFAVALLASGLAASGVGTYAGQVVMQGFIRRSVPVFVRRLVTIAPALVILAVGVDPTEALVISQVILSFGIPFALVPLILFTSRRDVMADMVNGRLLTGVAGVVAGLIIVMNGFLLTQVL